jgi:hypothetical protein
MRLYPGSDDGLPASDDAPAMYPARGVIPQRDPLIPLCQAMRRSERRCGAAMRPALRARPENSKNKFPKKLMRQDSLNSRII